MRTEDRIDWTIPAGETGWQVAPFLFAKVRANAYAAIPLGREGTRAPTPLIVYRGNNTRVIGGLAKEFITKHWGASSLKDASSRILLALVAYVAKAKLQGLPKPLEVVQKMLPFEVTLSCSGGKRPETLEDICAPEWCIELLRFHGLGVVDFDVMEALTSLLPYGLRAIEADEFDARTWDYAAIYDLPSPLVRALREHNLGIRRVSRRKR